MNEANSFYLSIFNIFAIEKSQVDKKNLYKPLRSSFII